MERSWEEQKTRGIFEQRFGELHRDTELVLGYRPFAIVFHQRLSHIRRGEKTYTSMRPTSNVLHRRSITFQTSRIKHIVTVLELHDTSNRIPNTQIIVCTQVLKRLHQSTSHITGFGSLDCSVDQTFSTRHGVEKEFGRSEAGEERIADEPLGGRVLGLFAEMRKRPILETVSNTRTTNDLLTDTGNHLGDVNDGTYIFVSNDLLDSIQPTYL